MKFWKACLSMLKANGEKLQERCPLKYLVVSNASCLEPASVISEPKVNKLQFSALVEKLYSANREVAENAKVQFDKFLSVHYKQNCEAFSQYKWKEQWLDVSLHVY